MNDNSDLGYKWMIDGIPMNLSQYQNPTKTGYVPEPEPSNKPFDKEQVKVQVSIWMKEGIQSVLDGRQDSVELLYCRPADVLRYIISIGGSDLEDFDTNGWQWDYWFNVVVKGREYNIEGDGYFSDSATFSLKN